jgi:L-glutamine-phosphate cytidylyltransferase
VTCPKKHLIEPDFPERINKMEIIILAAGIGSRLGHPYPKSLTMLKTGKSIMRSQLDNLGRAFPDNPVTVVVGFKKEMIMEAFPDLIFTYNNEFDSTNTSKSLLKALNNIRRSGALWLNGDVVFDAMVLEKVKSLIKKEASFVCVNKSRVGEEEVKYTVDNSGHIRELSKKVKNALGEAVGINYIGKSDVGMLVKRLAECAPNDYFEKAIEVAIEKDGLKVVPADISEFNCIEVDFKKDLDKANELL